MSSSPTILLRPQCGSSYFQPLLLLSLPRHTTTFPSLLFSPLSPLSLPQIPLTHYLRFFFSFLDHSSCEHLIIPYLLFLFSLPSLIAFPPLISLFLQPLCISSCHLLTSTFFFSLLTSIKACIVSLSGVPTPNTEKMLQEMNRLTAECMWRISPLF